MPTGSPGKDRATGWYGSGEPTPGWAEAVNTWRWQPKRGSLPSGEELVVGWYKTGDCPWCGHSTTVWARPARALGVLPELRAITPVGVKRRRCECTSAEHGRPPAFTDGCGAFGAVEMPDRVRSVGGGST